MDVRTIRKQKGWTQAQLAAFLGLNRSSISRLEHGQPVPGPTKKLLLQLAEGASEGDRPVAQAVQ